MTIECQISNYPKTMLDSRQLTLNVASTEKKQQPPNKTTPRQHLEKNLPGTNLQLASWAAWRNTRAHRDTASCRSDPFALANVDGGETDEVPRIKRGKLPDPQGGDLSKDPVRKHLEDTQRCCFPLISKTDHFKVKMTWTKKNKFKLSHYHYLKQNDSKVLIRKAKSTDNTWKKAASLSNCWDIK